MSKNFTVSNLCSRRRGKRAAAVPSPSCTAPRCCWRCGGSLRESWALPAASWRSAESTPDPSRFWRKPRAPGRLRQCARRTRAGRKFPPEQFPSTWSWTWKKKAEKRRENFNFPFSSWGSFPLAPFSYRNTRQSTNQQFNLNKATGNPV